MEFEWNIFPGFNTLQLSEEVKRLLFRLDETPENFTGRILFMSMFNDISCGSRDSEKEMPVKCQTRISVREKIWKRTMVIYWSWFWKEVVLYQWRQSTRSMGQYSWKDVGWIRRKRMSNFPRYEPIVQRSTQKQRSWKIVDTPCSRFGNDWDYFSHNCFCKPAQSLRSSRGDMWRVWIRSRENGETRCDGTIEILTRAQCDQDRSFFGLWWPNKSRSSIAAIWRTNSKLSQQDECCWNWTILQDERHCRSLTISCSGLSWIHSSKRRKSITTKRMIQGNTNVGPVLVLATCCLHGVRSWDQNLVFEQRQYLLLGQNFSWITKVCDELEQQWNRNSRRSARRICVKTGCERFCMPIEGKSTTTKKRTCRLFTKNSPYWEKELDRYWTREIFSLRIRSVEESNVSSSSFTTCASRRRWSSSFLEN